MERRLVMDMGRKWPVGATAAAAVMVLALSVGCSDKTEAGATGSVTAAASPAANASVTAVPTYTPVGGGAKATVEGAIRQNAERGTATKGVEKAAPVGAKAALLQGVTIRQTDTLEAIAFDFDGPVPGYKVEYAATATQCGSGQPVALPGAGVIVVRISPAAAHDASGKSTGAPASVPGMTEVTQAKQICDSEGVVSYAVGVKAKGAFEVTTVGNRLVVAVGVK
jgi:LysM repeat protein